MSDVCPCHGEPWGLNAGRHYCRIKRRAQQRIAAVSEKGRARRRRADARYRATHFRLRIGEERTHLGTYPVNPEQRERIRAFRADQRKEPVHGR